MYYKIQILKNLIGTIVIKEFYLKISMLLENKILHIKLTRASRKMKNVENFMDL